MSQDNIHRRTWWRPARKASEPHEDRSVSFLELFYDLVFVLLIAEISHALAKHPDVQGIGHFVFLFAIVWWSWFISSAYYDNHGNNDVRTRVFTFGQMLMVMGMAVYAHDAFGEGSKGFALFFGGFQTLMALLFWRLQAHDPEHIGRNSIFLWGYLGVVILIFLSVLIPAPYRFYIWGLSIVVNLFQPLLMFVNHVRSRTPRPVTYVSPALVERFGLFTIIVLAEVLIGVVRGMTSHGHPTAESFAVGLLGACIAFALWWVYFDFVSHRHPIEREWAVMTWMYMDLFISMSIVAIGAAVLNLVEHAGGQLEPDLRWLLVVAVAVFLVALFVLMRVVKVGQALRKAYHKASNMMVLAACIIPALGLTHLPAVPLMAVIVIMLLLPLAYAIVFYVRRMEARYQAQLVEQAEQGSAL